MAFHVSREKMELVTQHIAKLLEFLPSICQSLGFYPQHHIKPNVQAQACNLSTCEVEPGELEVQGPLGWNDSSLIGLRPS